MPRKKQENMTLAELEDLHRKIRNEWDELSKKIEPLQNKSSCLSAKLRNIQELIDTKKIADKKRIDWEWMLHVNNDETMVKHRKREEELRKLGLIASGFFSETQQEHVEVMLIKGDPKSLKQTLAGLKKILPIIKPLPKDDFKHVGIFEHTCSEYGVYEMHINEEKGHYEIIKTVYHRPSSIKTFATLRDMIIYIQQNIWYESKDGDKEECNPWD